MRNKEPENKEFNESENLFRNSIKKISEDVVSKEMLSPTFRKFFIIESLEKDKWKKDFLNSLIKITGLNLKILAEKVFEVTPKTLSSYKNHEKAWSTHMKELWIKLDELYNLGLKLFMNRDNFNQWLSEESYGLGGRVPLNILNSSTGIDLVYEELKRIEYGATA